MEIITTLLNLKVDCFGFSISPLHIIILGFIDMFRKFFNQGSG